MEELQKISKRQLDKINSKPKVKYLKYHMESKIACNFSINSIKKTFVKLFKLLCSEVIKVQHKFLRNNAEGIVTLYFINNNSQIFFKNVLTVSCNRVLNNNLNITSEEINELFMNFMNNNSSFPEIIQENATKFVIEKKIMKWKDIEINQFELFSCRYTPSALVSISKSLTY